MRILLMSTDPGCELIRLAMAGRNQVTQIVVIDNIDCAKEEIIRRKVLQEGIRAIQGGLAQYALTANSHELNASAHPDFKKKKSKQPFYKSIPKYNRRRNR